MSHPLVNKLTDLSDEELTMKLGELHSKYAYASRANPYLASQIYALIDDYNAEMLQRQAEHDKEIEEALGTDFFSDNVNIK